MRRLNWPCVSSEARIMFLKAVVFVSQMKTLANPQQTLSVSLKLHAFHQNVKYFACASSWISTEAHSKVVRCLIETFLTEEDIKFRRLSGVSWLKNVRRKLTLHYKYLIYSIFKIRLVNLLKRFESFTRLYQRKKSSNITTNDIDLWVLIISFVRHLCFAFNAMFLLVRC